jgi:hypothetical protein
LLLAACATQPPVKERSTVLAVILRPATSQSGHLPTSEISHKTRALDLRIILPRNSAMAPVTTYRHAFELNPDFLQPARAHLSGRLTGIPIELELRETGANHWVLAVLPNVVELLAHDGKRASYSGALELDSTGKSLPLRLTFESARPARPGPKSAG